MSIFITCVHGVAGLQADATGVVHHALADERQVTGRAASGGTTSLIMRGGSVLPALTPSRPPQPSAARSSASKTSIARPDDAADGRGDVGHPARREVTGRRVGEVPGQGLGRRRRRATGDAVARPPPSGDAPATSVTACSSGRRTLRLQRAEAVAGEQDALDDDLAGDVGRHGADVAERGRQRRVLRRRPGEGRRGVAQLGGGRARPDRRRPRPPSRRRRGAARRASGRPCRRSRRRRAAARSSPSCRGTGPFGATGRPRASADDGIERATVTVGVRLDRRRRIKRRSLLMTTESARRRRRRAPAASSRRGRPASGPSSTAGRRAG